jgi:hypothetical protein
MENPLFLLSCDLLPQNQGSSCFKGESSQLSLSVITKAPFFDLGQPRLGDRVVINFERTQPVLSLALEKPTSTVMKDTNTSARLHIQGSQRIDGVFPA